MSPRAENKTQPTTAKVAAFLAKEKDARRRADCEALVTLMSEVTGEPAVMWGTSIVGFGSYHYRYDSGREGDSMLIGFSPRKAAITIYAMGGVWEDPGRLAALGRCTGGNSCLYVKSLADIRLPALRRALAEGARRIRALYPTAGAQPAKAVASQGAKKPARKAVRKTTKKTARKPAR